MGRKQNRCSKKERETRRAAYAETFKQGFTMGYNMGYVQGRTEVLKDKVEK